MKKLICISILLSVCFLVYSAEKADKLRIRNEGPVRDNNYILGELDMLILKQAALTKTYAMLKQELTDHIFDKRNVVEKLPPVYVSRPNPYIIELICRQEDESVVSKEVFSRIHKACIKNVSSSFNGNRLNEKRGIELEEKYNSGTTCAERLDYCTYAITLDGSYLGRTAVVRVDVELYHQPSALAALELIQHALLKKE